MRKILISLLLFLSVLNAGLVDAIAIIVNNEPITLYDIDEKMVDLNIKKEQAVGILIEEKLYNQEVKKYNIAADIFDVNNYLEKVAASNGMDLLTFKSILKQQYKDYDKFVDETKKRIIHEKLIRKIVRGNLKFAKEEDLKIYYDNNFDKFNIASKVDVTQYSSKSKKELLSIKSNPLLMLPGVKQQNLTLERKNLNSQIRFVLNDTKEGSFTPIFTANKEFVMFYIIKKKEITTLKYEDVKDKILNVVMKEREAKYLKEYFEKLKITADIKILR